MMGLRPLGFCGGAFALTAATAVLWNLGANANTAADPARDMLRAMSDYVASQKTISLSFDSSIEVVTADKEKIQFNNSGTLALSRPDKLRAARKGGYADVEMFYDGKLATFYGKGVNKYVQIDASGGLDDLVDKLRGKGASLPAADLLLSNVYGANTADVSAATHIGEGVIDGVECEHLAFRQKDVDWQLWIEKGPTPIPRKLVITSTAVVAAPEYTLVIKDWKTDPPVDEAGFSFTPPDGAQKVGPESLPDFDELPKPAQ
jgi:hypothetical protein